jgi:hypothetical protein
VLGAASSIGCGVLLGLDSSADHAPAREDGVIDAAAEVVAAEAAALRCRIDDPFERSEPLFDPSGAIRTAADELFPRLTPNELILYFFRADSTTRIFRAERHDTTQPFAAPEEIPLTGLIGQGAAPVADDTRIYLATGPRTGPLQLRFTHRQGGEFSRLPRTSFDPIAPNSASTPFVLGDVLFFTHVLGGETDVWSARIGADGRLSEAAVVAGINATGVEDSTPTLSSDGLAIYFYSERDAEKGAGGIWVAQRRRRDEGFAAPARVTVFSPGPWVRPGHLSDDACRLYCYGPSENGDVDIWMASRSPR